MVALPETGMDEACATAERLRAMIQDRPVRLPDGSGEITVTISVGVALGQNHPAPSAEAAVETEVKGLIDQADRALYGAKASGRNAVEISRTAA